MVGGTRGYGMREWRESGGGEAGRQLTGGKSGRYRHAKLTGRVPNEKPRFAMRNAVPPPRTATPRTARLINDRAAFELLLDRGPLTRSQLRALTGLSGPTVAALIHRLEAAGLVAAVGEAGAERRGPNARLFGVVADRAHVAGVEVRPDAVVAVVTDLTGRSVGTAEVPQDPAIEPHRLVLAALDGALAHAGLAADRLHTVVVGTPGLVDPETGDLSYVARLPTWHANVLPGLRDRYGNRVLLENEVNLVGLAEHRLGAARGQDTFALLSLGSGIGVALVLDGRLLRGTSGGAGELAYVRYGRASLQEYLGGAAVLALARTHGLHPSDVGTTAGESTGLGSLVRAAAASTGPDARAFLDDLAERVGVGAAALCAVLDPGYLVLAGDVGRAGGEVLAGRVASRLAALVPLRTEVVPGTIGAAPDGGASPNGTQPATDVAVGNPVVRGAVLVALDLLHRETFGTQLPA